MNLNPNATTILCYGDSNTYGQKPDRGGRFSVSARWTGVLQSELGDNYAIIEEGLGGRTTDLEHPNPNKPGRGGLTYFKACLTSHSPLAMVIIMLGTNDFKTHYNRSVEEIADAIEQYIDYIESSYKESETQPTILLVNPPYMDDTAPQFYSSMPTPDAYNHLSVEKSRELAAHVQTLAEKKGTSFIDAALYAQVGDDGCHMTAQSHDALGQAIANVIRHSEQ